jgi:hypothetical protein
VTALSVHGIVAAGGDAAPPASEVELVEVDGIAALATPGTTEGRPRRRDFVRHSDVLQQAVAVTTVLPLRFGTVFESREELVEEFLRPRRDELGRLLAELEGKVEMSFEGSLREEAVLRELVAQSPEVAALRAKTRNRPEEAAYAERVQLGELVSAGLAARRAELEQRFLDCVAPHVVATLLPEEPSSPTTIRASLLVPRDAVGHLEEALEEYARAVSEHLEARLLGPLPPYSFVAGSAAVG